MRRGAGTRLRGGQARRDRDRDVPRADRPARQRRTLYSVRAQITVDGVLWFTSDTIAPVLTRGAGTDVELVLVRVP
ncbi:MAG: hypothetical protein DCC53_04625 [Chloroflexi bacterium]|nr:MAG: hypothetical protein DCC53_04625 [Chloroflexota bacterium]